MKRLIYVVDAFTSARLDGNSAGVVPQAEGLSANLMQKIAREVNSSETAFVTRGEGCDFKIRFFSPVREVPFCGHALLGAVIALIDLGLVEVEGNFARILVETGAGRHPVDVVRENGKFRVDVEQATPVFRDLSIPADALSSALGIAVDEFSREFPLGIAYTGLWHILAGLEDVNRVKSVKPDFAKLSRLNAEAGVDTTHVYAKTDTGFYCRSFAPEAGTNEDPVTGSASGALGAFLLRHGHTLSGAPVYLEQRDRGGRGGIVRVVASKDGDAVAKVTVGGTGLVSIRGEIECDDD